MPRALEGKRVPLPNPHGTEVSGHLLAKILRDVNTLHLP